MSFGKWIGFIALVISLYVLWEIRQIVLLLFTAVILADALNILVNKLQNLAHKLAKKYGWYDWKLKRGYAILLTIGLSIVVFLIFFWLIIPPFATQFRQLAVQVPQGIERLNIWIDGWIIQLEQRLSFDLSQSLPDLNQLTVQLPPLFNKLVGQGWTFFSNSLVVILNILLLLILTLMLLADPQPYRQGFIRLVPSFYRRRMDEILKLCDRALQGWLIGILFNMLVISVLSFLGLLALRIPLALAQAMLAGILTFIPNIGPALSVVPPIAISLLEEPWKAWAVLVIYFLIQQIETNLLTPFVMAQQVSLLPAITLLSQVFFASLFGFFGLFLALPLTVVGQVLLKEVLIKDILDKWETAKNNKNINKEF